MTQLTVRGFDEEVERRLRALAEEEGLSLSQAALRLLRRGAGLEPVPPEARAVGGALDRFVGALPAEDAAELEERLQVFETVDAELWR